MKLFIHTKMLLIMTFIWLIPIALYQLYNNISDVDIMSVVALFVPVVITITNAIILNAIILNCNTKISEIIRRDNIYTNIFIFNITYVANVIIVMLLCSDFGGGDAGGSYFLLFIPTILVYWVLSIIVSVCIFIKNMFRKT